MAAASLLIGLGLATWMLVKERQENQRANAEEKKALAEAAQGEREAVRARRAEAEAKDKLWDSYLAQAQAKRFSRHPGRRYEALQSLKKAAEIRPALELRNEAIASLALTDLRVGRQWELEHGYRASYDSAYERYAYWRTNGVLTIRRIQDDSEVMRLSGVFPQIGWLLKFSPNGRWLAVTRATSLLELEVWDLERNRAAVQFPGRDCRTMDFSSDSRLAAIAFHNGRDTNNPIIIYDLLANRIEATLKNGALPHTLRFHPTKTQLAVSSQESEEVQIWDIESRNVVERLRHPRGVTQIAWNPEGDLLASGCMDFQVYLWDIANKRPAHVLPGHSGFPWEVSFSFDGRFLASRGFDGALSFWDPWTGLQIFKQSVLGGTSGFSNANYRDGYYPSRDKMGFFELEPSRECRLLRPGSMSDTRGQNCDFSPDGRLLLTAHEDGARLWNPTSGKVVAFLDEKQTRFAIFEPHDDKFLVASDSGIKEWTIRRDPGGHIAEVVSSRPISDAAADELTLSQSGSALEFSVGNSIHVLNMTTGVEKIFGGPGDWRLYTSLSPDGQLVACGQVCDRMTKGGACPVRLHKVANGELVWEVPQREGARPLFSPNEKWLLTGDDREYYLWDLETRRLVYSISRGDAGYTAFMALSDDSATVALALSRDTVRLIEAVSGRELATLEAPEAHDIYWLRFSPDGSRLAVLYRDGPVHIWDLRLIRGQLAEMNLDWELSPLPGANKESAAQILPLSQ